MIVANECVIARKVVSKVENELSVNGDANNAGYWRKSKCSMQKNAGVPSNSSL